MRQFALWSCLIVALAAAGTIAVVRYPSQLVQPGALSPGHAYIGDQCTACHAPTVGVTVEKCTACHANAERLPGRQPTTFHASIEECAVCHIEHQGASPRPLVMDHAVLAQVGARTLARASETDPDSAATLASLETWLRLRRPAQFDAGSALLALDCAGCHDRSDPHLQRFGGDCAECHGLESWRVPGYQHPSARSTDCVQCHKPPASHSMGHFSMVSQKAAGKEQASIEQCFECHNTTGWNDIVDVGYYKHH